MQLHGRIEIHDVQPHTTSKGASYFDVTVGYSYQFQGEFYSGLFDLGSAAFREDAETKCQTFPIGMAVKIRVNPEHPEQSLLETNAWAAGI